MCWSVMRAGVVYINKYQYISLCNSTLVERTLLVILIRPSGDMNNKLLSTDVAQWRNEYELNCNALVKPQSDIDCKQFIATHIIWRIDFLWLIGMFY